MRPSTLSSKAIVLSKEVFGEADLYVQFLTQNWGVISVLARSAKKSKRRYVGGLDLFCHDEIFLKGDPRNRAYLLELSVLNSFTRIRESFEKVMVAGKVIQWVKKLAEASTPMPSLYSLLGQTLALIDQETDEERLELLALVFKLKFLSQLGLKPKVDSCVRCQGPLDEVALFDSGSGGALCSTCAKGSGLPSFIRLAEDERQLIDGAENLKLTFWNQFRFSAEKAHHLTQVVNQFASFHTHARLPI